MNSYALSHYAARRGSLQAQPQTQPQRPNIIPTTTQRLISSAMFGTAAALYYTRDPSVIKAAGAGIIAPVYLIYRGVQYAQEKMG
tara:strand:- start:59 stop:313 length:255 start_codon:yes stop_codon:yes gene_type:complete